jgi:peptide subunit release factor 1 (eRF1)
MIQREINTASNIKDKKTRKNVTKALNKIVRLNLNMFADNEHGLIIYSANDKL